MLVRVSRRGFDPSRFDTYISIEPSLLIAELKASWPLGETEGDEVVELKVCPADEPAARRAHYDVGDAAFVTHVRDVTPVGRKLRESQYRPVAREAALVKAVIIHHSNRIARDVGELRCGYAVAPGQQFYYLVGELVRHRPRVAGVARGDKLLLRLYVEKVRVGDKPSRVL